MKRILLSLLLHMAVNAWAQHPVIDELVTAGLENNLALRQQNFAYEESLYKLKEARGKLWPSVSIEARYSRAGGGREILFPVGDLMNPVYQTLNQYLVLNGQPARFPENLPNERIPFLREKEQESKLRLVQPIFQPALWKSISIQQRLTNIQMLQRQTFARQLVQEIKEAYYNALKAHEAEELYKASLSVLQEHVRVNEKLYQQQKVIMASVWRARAEEQAVALKLQESIRDAKLALAYLNFLLNRPQDTPVTFIDPAVLAAGQPLHLVGHEVRQKALTQREELQQLALSVEIAGKQKGVAQSAFLPGLSLVADYGIQGEDYYISRDSDYWMASLVLSWNLFNGWQDKNRVSQATLYKKRLAAQQKEAEARITLQVTEALENRAAALKSLEAAGIRQKAAQEAFRAYKRQYEENMVTQLEYLDAQNQSMQAGVALVAAQADLMTATARLERITAQNPLPERKQ